MQTHQIKTRLIDSKNKGLSNIKIQVWDKDRKKDDFLGEAISNQEGECMITFDTKQFEDYKGELPDIYFKIFQKKKLIADTRDDIIEDLKEKEIFLIIKIPYLDGKKQEGISMIYPFPFNVNQLNKKLTRLSAFGNLGQGYIERKLNDAFHGLIYKALNIDTEQEREKVLDLGLTYAKFKKSTIKECIEKKLLPRLKTFKTKEEQDIDTTPIKARSTSSKKDIPKSISIAEELNLNWTLNNHPLFKREAQQVKLFELARIARVNGNTTKRVFKIAKKLFRDNVYWEYPKEKIWSSFLEKNYLKKSEKEALQYVFELDNLTGGYFNLIETIFSLDRFPAAINLVGLKLEDWKNLIIESGNRPPTKESTNQYAKNIMHFLDRAFPSAFLMERMAHNGLEEQLKHIPIINKLRKNNPQRLKELDSDGLKWEGIPQKEKRKILASVVSLKKLTNKYRYLGLAETLSNEQLSLKKKQDNIRNAIVQLQVFYQNNPNFDLQTANLIDNKDAYGNGFTWKGVSKEYQPLLLKQKRAYQRVLLISPDFESSNKLLESGFDSAPAITAISSKIFQRLSGLSNITAEKIYERAKRQTSQSIQNFQALRDVAQKRWMKTYVDNTDLSLINELKDVDGYDVLFGSQNFCTCEHHRSIFGPAAYFTDLMYFLEKNLIIKGKTPQNHPILLKNRRPNLWSLKLTYENTFKMIPYLSIINGVMGDYISQKESGDINATLASSNASFNLPYNIPFSELLLYLKHFDIKLHKVYELFEESEENWARAYLGCSPEEWNVIKYRDITNIFKRFGYRRGRPIILSVETLLRATKITREELSILIKLKYVNRNRNLKIIQLYKKGDIQPYSERLLNWDRNTLDRIHRFLRIWQKLPWTMEELDAILIRLTQIGNYDPLSNDLSSLARLLQIQKYLNLSISDLTMIVYEDLSIYDMSFTFHHAYFNQNDKEDHFVDPITLSIIEFLKISEQDLLVVFKHLQDFLEFDETGNFSLSKTKVNRLFSYAKLSQGFRLKMEEFICLLGGGEFPKENQIKKQSEFIKLLIERNEKVKKIPLSLLELQFIINGKENGKAEYKVDLNLLEETFNSLISLEQTREGVNINDLYSIKDVNNDIIDAFLKIMENEGMLIIVENHISELGKYFFSSSKIRDIILKVDDELLREDLENNYPKIQREIIFHFASFFRKLITQCLEITKEEYLVLSRFLPVSYFNMLLIDKRLSMDWGFDLLNDRFKKFLLKFSNEFERLILLFFKLDFENEEVRYIAENKKVIDFSYLGSLSFEKVFRLVELKKWLGAKKEMKKKEVKDIFKSFQIERTIPETSWKELGKILEIDAYLIKSVFKAVIPTSQVSTINPIDAFGKTREGLELCATLGIDGNSIIKLTGKNFQEIMAAKDIVYGAFRTKYPKNNEWHETIEPYQDQINSIKRDIYKDYILSWRQTNKIKDEKELYAHLLLDPEMGECARISKVKAATLSVQLYIHRCLMHLEQSADGTQAIIDPSGVEEWEWRKNYRVWEANRKIFLYPENYLEPDLRDNKSPIFKKLEDELLQEKISKAAAEKAYNTYMKDFLTVARLKIVGSCFYEGEDNQQPTYYFFGRTLNDPYLYFFRKYECIDEETDKWKWTSWEKVELNIVSPWVSPIVYQGKLFLFWLDYQINKTNKIDIKNMSNVENFEVKYNINYSFIDEFGKWIQPQRKLSLTSIYPEKYIDILDRVKAKAKEEDLNWWEELLKIYPNIKQEIETESKDDVESWWNLFLEDFYESFDDIIKKAKGINRLYHDIERPLNFGYQEFSEMWKPKMFNEKAFNRWLDLFSNDFIDDNVVLTVFGNFLNQKALLANPRPSGGFELSNIIIENFYNFLKEEGFLRLYKEIHGLEVFSELKPMGSDILAISENNSSGELRIIQNSIGDYILHNTSPVSQSQFFLRFKKTNNTETDYWKINRLSVSTPELLGRKLAKLGLESFLNLDSQNEKFTEILFSSELKIENRVKLIPPYENYQHLDFNNAYGLYYKELFFHIPFLIANHLNANQKFKEAKWWYERIFNPMSKDEEGLLPPSDRNWQYMDFRGRGIEKLREIIKNDEAIDAYQEDPFNPHAIARARDAGNAYQKSIVMKYIDNLLDWGDRLFSQDSFESINEAMMLYILASDILGKKPKKLGKCITLPENELTYENLKTAIEEDSEFLISLENWRHKNATSKKINLQKALSDNEMQDSENSNSTYFRKRNNLQKSYQSFFSKNNKELENEKANTRLEDASLTIPRSPEFDIAKQMLSLRTQNNGEKQLAFCVPPNYNLHSYWDRVGDRLFKIRNCMNISGVRRQLALFQPPIDPALLVRAKAGGLNVDDILSELQETIPPYRFSFLIEKAKAFTNTVQSFGSALLSALEKKDVEELNLLRSVHEQNILKLTKEIKEKQIEESVKQIEQLVEAEINVQNKVDYYQGLIDEGLILWENTQQIAQHAGNLLMSPALLFSNIGTALDLIPKIIGFSFSTGGDESAKYFEGMGKNFKWNSDLLYKIADSAKLEAGFQRREQEWKQQLKLTKQELVQIGKQKLAADIRRQIAEDSLTAHKISTEQSEELYSYYKDKFTNLGLYNYYATTLGKLYRQAYNMALNMAKKAERAYQFEIEDNTRYIQGDNWDMGFAGLLAGEKLILQLQRLEQNNLEKNVREQEVTQSFSMLQWAPQQFNELRINASGIFTIPEIAFNVLYLGQYRRRIKSVSLTIPCIVGPYVNVSCKLTLEGSKIRLVPNITDELATCPYPKNISISTSSAQSDSGVFELNFRDERYLPFEGHGAVDSKWLIELPKTFKQFDYNTISDVILTISYTAKEDGKFRNIVETDMNELINKYANNNEGGLARLFSLKRDFPNEWHELKNGANKVDLKIYKKHFPFFLHDEFFRFGKAFQLTNGEDGKTELSDLVFETDESLVERWVLTIEKSQVEIAENIDPDNVIFLVQSKE